jgi:lysophospholipase L1-like esterase
MARRSELTNRAVLVVGSVVVALIVLELGCRVARGPEFLWTWPNFVAREWAVNDTEVNKRFIDDPLLGHLPKPAYRSNLVNYDPEGRRVMPAPPADAIGGPPVLVTGDSFAEGEEVKDGETWPAYLQELLKRRVINVGVSGFALDQAVLRTVQQAEMLHPGQIVMSFAAGELYWNEMHHLWGGEKPYFTVADDGTLVLHNVPVPPRSTTERVLPFWQRAFGWSALLELVLKRMDWWVDWLADEKRATPRETAEKIVCPMMRRIAALGVPALVVAQYNRWTLWTDNAAWRADVRRQADLVLRCATAAGLATLDTYGVAEQAVRARGIDAIYIRDHHTPDGNRLIAEAIAAALKQP